MKKTKFAILLFLGACLCTFAQHGGNASFEIVENSLRKFLFRIRISDFDTITSENYTRLFVDEDYTTGFSSGEPELPVLHKIIAVPEKATPKLVFHDKGTKVVTLSRKVFPIQTNGFKNRTVENFCMNSKIYGSTEVYGNDLVRLSPMGIFRNLRLYRITVSPFEYNPVKNKLILHDDISVEVRFDGADYGETKRRLQQTAGLYNFSGIANRSVYEDMLARNTVAPRYLIVAQDTFRNSLLEFARWKRQEGFDVEFLIPSRNSTPDSIRDLLKDMYLHSTPKNPAPVFVTIVGDTNHVGTFEGKVSVQGIGRHNTDLYFAEYTGDFYPDALVGRISVADTAELRHVLQKILKYEKYHLQDTDYLQRVIQVAGQEARRPAPTTTNGTVNYLRDVCSARNASLDTICFYNPASGIQLADIVREISEGASLLYYTAHGDRNGWLRPDFNTSIADTLGNAGKYFFSVNNCCLSNSFSSEVCFGEKLLRLHDAGAIGVIGAANETLWDEDYYWAVGAKYPFELNPRYDSTSMGTFDRLLHVHGESHAQTVATQAQMLQAGNFAVAQSGSPYENYYWEIYSLLGDPSTMPYVGIPQKINLVVPDSLPVGTSRIDLQGTPFARVSVLQDTDLLLSATLDATGMLSADLSSPIDTGSLLVTATAQFFRPHTDTVRTYISARPKLIVNGMALQNVQQNGNLVAGKTYSVDAEFLNAGSAVSENAVLSLFSLDGKCFVSMNYQQADTVLPQNRLSEQNVATISVASNAVDGDILHVKLMILENGDTSFAHTYAFVVENSNLGLGVTEFRKDGTLVKMLQKDSVYAMKIPVVNFGTQVSDTLQIVLKLDTVVAQCLSADTFRMLPIVPQQADTADFMIRVNDVRKNKLEAEICVADADTIFRYSEVYPLNRALEDFETGDFTRFAWDTTYVNTWTTDTSCARGGRFSARSSNIHDRQRSMIQITLDVLADDTLSFYAKVSCERGADYLYFYIDGTREGLWTGNIDWQKCSFPVPQGRHTFLWKYEKDDSYSSGSDCAWIDDVDFPFSRLDSNYRPQQTENIPKTETLRFKIFPNPVKEVLIMENLENEAVEIDVCTALGQMVDKIIVNPCESIYYNPSNLRSGTYTLILHNDKKLSVEKITVAK